MEVKFLFLEYIPYALLDDLASDFSCLDRGFRPLFLCQFLPFGRIEYLHLKILGCQPVFLMARAVLRVEIKVSCRIDSNRSCHVPKSTINRKAFTSGVLTFKRVYQQTLLKWNVNIGTILELLLTNSVHFLRYFSRNSFPLVLIKYCTINLTCLGNKSLLPTGN